MIDRIKGVFSRLSAWMDDLLFPENVLCLCCDCALGEEDEDGVCSGCRKALEQLACRQEMREAEGGEPCPPGIDDIHAAFVYEGPARKLIHRLKYESVRAAAVPLAKQMTYLPSGEEEVIVPVPTDPVRERRRGFNQAALLAEHIGKELGMPVEHALVRVSSRRPQTGLSLEERKANLSGCMQAGQSIRGKRVLLVDDVCTTGSTLAEAAGALHQAGAKSIGVFTAARAAGGMDEAQDPFALPVKRGRHGEKR